MVYGERMPFHGDLDVKGSMPPMFVLIVVEQGFLVGNVILSLFLILFLLMALKVEGKM